MLFPEKSNSTFYLTKGDLKTLVFPEIGVI